RARHPPRRVRLDAGRQLRDHPRGGSGRREDHEAIPDLREGDRRGRVSKSDARRTDMRLLLVLLIGGLVGTLFANVGVITGPYIHTETSLVVTGVLVEMTITLVAVVTGLAVAKSTGLGSFDLRACLSGDREACRRLIRASAITSAIVAVVSFFIVGLLATLDAEGSKRLVLEHSNQPHWKRLMTCIGAGIREEIRSEEHTSELQSHSDIVCRLLLENTCDIRRSISECCLTGTTTHHRSTTT